ncbi:universal stress protein [Prescottella agglutinans]|uniref:Universal stress protein n=1 Tax=Prescottella agglutinans TaxID=1644129 RepID=A0A3S3CYF5_9NOCA|nr:universal stress protein [Prescottella agglutinans]RVW08720.1 universal stress protein [Prescottella agglutinans]
MITAPIVVGVDGSTTSRDAVRWAAHEARIRGDALLLVSSVSTGGIGLGSPFIDDLQIAGERAVADARELVAVEDPQHTVEVRTELSRLAPAQALLEHAESARMIVLGTRGLGEFTSGLAGSVTSAVARHARCPVAVVPGWPNPGEPALTGPVVVGVDGSPAGEPATAAAFEEASLHHAELVALHAWSDRDLAVFGTAPPNRGDRIEWPSTEAAERAVLAEALAGWQEKYPDVAVRTIVVQDRPVRNLLMHGTGARLIVVGSRGRGGFQGMTLGSTSTALLHTVTCPLLVVRSR